MDVFSRTADLAFKQEWHKQRIENLEEKLKLTNAELEQTKLKLSKLENIVSTIEESFCKCSVCDKVILKSDIINHTTNHTKNTKTNTQFGYTSLLDRWING
jgi:hypothetical protein